MSIKGQALFNSIFHKVIERPGQCLTILSASEDGLAFGKGQKFGAVKDGYSKSVSVFAELVTLCEVEKDFNITFGSSEADEVTLSTTRLLIKHESSSVVLSARGKHGEPNTAGTKDGREKTHGQPGHMLNVFVGQASSQSLDIEYEARGGKGATTRELDHTAGTGGDGGVVGIIFVSTWAPILQHLREAIDLVRVRRQSLQEELGSQATCEQPPSKVFEIIAGIIRSIERMCENDDPLRKEAVSRLAPLLGPETDHNQAELSKILTQIHKEVRRAMEIHATVINRSIDVSGGSGGSAARIFGERGNSGGDGAAGMAYSKTVIDSSVAGPLSFAPLHPVQCQMQLEKASALLYIGEHASIDHAKRILARLSAKIGAVLDLGEDDTAATQAAMNERKGARENRLKSLEEAYRTRRDLIGIPREMKDPVSVLRQIAYEASAMLFQCTQTSVDFYGYQHNWAPRPSVEKFKIETETSLTALEKTETLYLQLAERLETKETDESVWRTAITQLDAGLQELHKERDTREKQLLELIYRIRSQVFKAELSRRFDELDSLLRELQRRADKNVEFGMDSFMKSFVNVAKEGRFSDLVGFSKEKEGEGKKDKDKKDEDKKDEDKKVEDKKVEDKKEEVKKDINKIDDRTYDLRKKIWNKFGSELTDKIWEGFTTVPDAEGKSVDKVLIARRITKVLGNLAEVAKKDEGRIIKDPETGELQLDKERDELLVTSKEQIDKFVEDFLSSGIGEPAKGVQVALKEYANLLADRNNDKIQYNLELKALINTDKKISAFRAARVKLQNEDYIKDDLGQLSQLEQIARDIYSWNRARTMRLLSLYRRAIYLATLVKPKDNSPESALSDAALVFSAVQLAHKHQLLHTSLFDEEAKAGSDASPFPTEWNSDRGKFVDLTPKQLKILLEYKQLRLALPASRRGSDHQTLPDFRGCADVRAYRVRFWLEGVRNKAPAQGQDVLVKIDIVHEGDSIYYDRSGEPHTFMHDPIAVSWSYRLLSTIDNRGRKLQVMDSGDIVTKTGTIMAYAAPSPFASWTISLNNLDFDRLDLSGVTKARFEFFGTSRSFH